MSYKIPPKTKQYILESLNNIKDLPGSSKIQDSLVGKGPSGINANFGGGGGNTTASDPNSGTKGAGDVLLGGNGTLGAAAGMYVAGEAATLLAKGVESVGDKAAGMLLKKVDPKTVGGGFAHAIKNSAIGQIANVAKSTLNQAADLSGKSWFDANFDRIAQNQLSLVGDASAGSPWVPIAIPQRYQTRSSWFNQPNTRANAVRIP